MAAGIAGFINGVFQGADWRAERDARKRAQEIQEERLGWARKDRDIDAADRARRIGIEDEVLGWRREDRGRRIREEDRALAEAEAERQAYRSAYDATLPQAYDDLPDDRTEAIVSPRESRVAEATDPAPVRRSAPGIMDPAAELGFGSRPEAGRPMMPDGRGEAIASGREGRGAAQVYTFEDWRRMSRAERQAADLPVSEIGGQMYFDRMAQAFGAAPARKAGRAAQAAYDSAERERLDGQSQRIVQDTPLPRTVTGPGADALRGEQRAAVERQQDVLLRPDVGLAFGDPRGGEVPISTPDGAPAPSVDIATQPARRNAPGITGRGMPARATAQQRERGSKSFLENYAKNGAPLVVEHYLKTGQPEKAKAFQAFIDDGQTKAAMAHWSRAAHAAAIGDSDGFADAIAKAYNSAGYYDDGISVVENETAFAKDDAGNIIGGVITFRNEDTGETFTQQLDGYADIVQMGLGMLAPESVFEQGWKQVEAQRAARAGLAAETRNAEAEARDPAKINAIFKELVAANMTSAAPKSTDELWKDARRMAAGEAAGASEDIPFLP